MYRLRVFVFVIFLIFISSSLYAKDDNSNVFTLGEVVVSDVREKADLATTVTKITEEDIKAQGAQTVAEALDLIPGVDVHTGGKGQAFVNIRGFEQEDVKVLIDGVPAHESYFGTLDLSLIPVDSISRITVTKGASSVLYGANTMGGVINIITKKGGKKLVGEFTTSFGDYDTRNYIFNHGAQAGDFNYWFTYGYRESDGFKLSDDFDDKNRHTGITSEYNEDGGRRDLSYYIKRNVNAKIGYEPDDETRIYLSFDYHNNERGCPTEFNRYWAFSQWNQWHINLIGEKRFNDFFIIKARGFYVDHDDTLSDVSWDTEHTTAKKWFERSSYDDYSTGGEVHTQFNFGDFSILKAGLNYLKDNHRQKDLLDSDCKSVQKGWDQPGWQSEEEYEADTYSFALENEINVIESLSFVLGASYDYFNPKKAYKQPVPDDIDSINPQAGVVFNFTDDMILHASIGKKTRFPQLKELYSEHAGGNPNLDPQKAVCYEVGADHSFAKAFKYSISCFYNDIDDMINREKIDKEWVYFNIGKASILGAETSFDLTFLDYFSLGANYTYLLTRDKENNNRELPDRPRHKVNFDFRYRSSFGFSADFQASYTQRQFEYIDDKKRKYPDYFLMNIGVSQKLTEVKGVESLLFVRVKNISDKNYDEGHPMPGRNFLAGLTLKY